MTPERLPEVDRRFYYNLPSPSDRESFLELEDEDRRPFLEQQGLWQRWAVLPAQQRDSALTSQVELGFAEFALYMAWGPPADTQTRQRAGRPVTVHTYIRCTSGPKNHQYVRNNLDCEGTSEETLVSLLNGVVVEIRYLN